MFMWMHDLPYLPYYISALMHQWMDMWMHVYGIKAQNERKKKWKKKKKKPNLAC